MKVLMGTRGWERVWMGLPVPWDTVAAGAHLLVPLGAVPGYLHAGCRAALGSLQEPGHQPAGAPADLEVPEGAGRRLRQLLRHLLGGQQLALPRRASPEQQGGVTVRTAEQAGLRAQPCGDAAIRCQDAAPDGTCPHSPQGSHLPSPAGGNDTTMGLHRPSPNGVSLTPKGLQKHSPPSPLLCIFPYVPVPRPVSAEELDMVSSSALV